MNATEQLGQQFDMDKLADQLQMVIDSKDPVGYMSNNINWEIDKESNDDQPLLSLTNLIGKEFYSDKSLENWNPFARFLNWLSRNRTAKSLKNILCSISAKIQELIDEEAELKKILGVAITAIIAAIGAGAINPVLLTLLVGMLATMILKGVANICGV